MCRRLPWLRGGVAALAVTLVWAGDGRGAAQTLHRTGQSVQPVYEGWATNDDGTFTMWFGYMNRNYEEEPHVPVGPENFFSPGPADRGQPTHFYPRRQNFAFGVTVPADWGDNDLVWTVTAHGETFTATGSLWDSWVLDEGCGRSIAAVGWKGGATRTISRSTAPHRRRVGRPGNHRVGRHPVVAYRNRE